MELVVDGNVFAASVTSGGNTTTIDVATGNPAETSAGKLTLQVMRGGLSRIIMERAQANPNNHYPDGRALYGETDAVDHPLPDALHPDGPTHQLMGERFATLAFVPGAPLGATA